MWLCKNCGTEVDNDNLLSCWNCGHGKDGSPPSDKAELEEARSLKADPRSPGLPPQPRPPGAMTLTSPNYAQTLRVCGWIDLALGIFGAAAVLFGWLSAPARAREEAGLYSLIVAAAVAFQGTLVFVLCQVIADMADQVHAIRSELRGRR